MQKTCFRQFAIATVIVIVTGLLGPVHAEVAELQNDAVAMIRAGEPSGAIDSLSQALEEDDGNAYTHYLLALAYLDSGQNLDKAGQHLNRATELGAQPQAITLLEARHLAQMGKDDDALGKLSELADGGYGQYQRVAEQSDFAAIHDEEEYQDAIAKIRTNRFPCEADPQHRDFDFWVGDWTVTQNGVYAGDNSITSILGGCLVFEQWTSASGGLGKSFNYFDPGKNHWRQIWVSDSGSIIEFTGQARDGGIFYTAETVDPSSGDVTYHRFEFTQFADGAVRQFWATSSDQEEWTTIWDGRYERKEQPQL